MCENEKKHIAQKYRISYIQHVTERKEVGSDFPSERTLQTGLCFRKNKMRKFIERWFVNALSLWIIDYLADAVSFAARWAVIFSALALTVLNATVKPILKAISLPVTILTLGLFSLLINGAVLWLAFSMNEGSAIASYGDAVWISIVLAIINSILGSIFKD